MISRERQKEIWRADRLAERGRKRCGEQADQQREAESYVECLNKSKADIFS